LSTNAEVIREAEIIQQKTKDSLLRVERQAAQAEALGENTLAELQKQRYQTQRIQMDGEDLNAKISKAKRLQQRFDNWSLNVGGFQKRSARREAKEEIKASLRTSIRSQIGKEESDIKEVNGDVNASPKKRKRKYRNPSRSRKTKIMVQPSRRTDLIQCDRNDPENANLDDESMVGLERLAKNDVDIDVMLDKTASTLDQLAALSVSINNETKAQKIKIETLTETLDKASKKQTFVNVRAKRFIKRKWRKQAKKQ